MREMELTVIPQLGHLPSLFLCVCACVCVCQAAFSDFLQRSSRDLSKHVRVVVSANTLPLCIVFHVNMSGQQIGLVIKTPSFNCSLTVHHAQVSFSQTPLTLQWEQSSNANNATTAQTQRCSFCCVIKYKDVQQPDSVFAAHLFSGISHVFDISSSSCSNCLCLSVTAPT